MSARKVLVSTLIVVGVLLSLAFLYLVRDVIVLLFFALLLATALEPPVNRLERARLPRTVAILLIYAVLVLTLTVSLQLAIPRLISEVSALSANLPAYLRRLQEVLLWIEESWGYRVELPDVNVLTSRLDDSVAMLAAGAVRVTTSVFGVLAGIITVFAFAYYWLMERRQIEQTWFALLPPDRRVVAERLWSEIIARLGDFLRGELLLMLFVGTLVWIGLVILGVPFAFVLGIIAGLTEVVPIIGPVIGAVPAVVIAFFQSPVLALVVIGLYILVQQVENNVLVPKVMARTVGLSPLTALLAVLVGGRVLGFVGIVLAVPVAAAVQTLVLRLVLEANRRGEGRDLERIGDRAEPAS